MFSVEELRFAQKFPFSSVAKRVIKEGDFSLDDVPETIVSRAKLMVSKSLKGEEYEVQAGNSATVLRDEIISFPLAKVFISVINSSDFSLRFSRMISKSVFGRLEKENDKIIFEIAQELKLKFFLADTSSDFVKVPLKDFLSGNVGHFFKLVNQRIERGQVVLTRNEFIRFISLVVEKQLFDSLPLGVSGVPKKIKSVAKELENEAFAARKAAVKDVVLGEVKTEFFPPCIQRLYTGILAGQNLNHMERFSLATFMISVGMPVEQIIKLYSFTPNFDEKVTTYQVTRLAGKGGTKYSAASCSKMAEFALRLPECPCNMGQSVRHPVQFYKNSFFKPKKTL